MTALAVHPHPLLAALLFAASPALGVQQEPGPSDYDRALAYLAAGDTAAAIVRLRGTLEEVPDHGLAHLRLGALLSAGAPEAERDYEQRREARRHLDRAYRLLGPEPELLLEFAFLLRKTGVGVDAKRLFEAAWHAGEEAGDPLPPDQRARLHYELARIFEQWWEGWHGLVIRPFQTPWRCVDTAVRCAVRWADDYDHLAGIENLKADERERMVAHYLLALEADPAHTDAAVRVLGHLADAERWELYDEVASNHVVHAPRDPRAHLMRGLGLHQRSLTGEAADAFDRALDLMEPEERRAFQDIGILLTRSVRDRYEEQDSAGQQRVRRMWFTAKDPLFLTAVNERRLEHYARVMWSDLKFSSPASGRRGWDSEQGRIWIRYGQPWRWYRCCSGGPRTLYWSYGLEGPLFTFTRNRTSPTALLTDAAAFLANELEAEYPEAYRPRMITHFYDLPHQLARFRGSEPDLTRLEIYAAPPIDSLGVNVGDALETGIFTFLEDYTPVWERRAAVDVSRRGVALTYRFEVPPGSYRYGLEARMAGPDSVPRPLARARVIFETDGFPLGRLSVSDLLLAADTIRSTEASPTRRDHLRLEPLRDVSVRANAPIHVYFEVYGIVPDDAGIGTYRAEVAVEDFSRRNFLERLLRAGRDLIVRGTPGTSVRWEREAVIVDGVVPEYVSLELPELPPGDFLIRVRLTDLTTGQEAESARSIMVVSPPAETG